MNYWHNLFANGNGRSLPLSLALRRCGAILHAFSLSLSLPILSCVCVCASVCFMRCKFKWSKCQRRKLIFLLLLFRFFVLSPFLLGMEHSTGPSISNEYFIHFFFFWCALFSLPLPVPECSHIHARTHTNTHIFMALSYIFYFIKT